jgi:Fis family transcriptional regulator, factor for inversion stimulation protein
MSINNEGHTNMSSIEARGKDTAIDRKEALSLLSNSNRQQSLRACVEAAVNNYFHHLDGQETSNVYDMVLAEVEVPLLEAVMKYTQKNQTKASSILGVNRSTLRKKLKKYGL